VKVHHITALGVDLIVIPSLRPIDNRIGPNFGKPLPPPAVGCVVDGDIECPTCHGIDLDPMLCGGCGRYERSHGIVINAGTVSVPHVVVAVVPLVANFEGATMPNAVLLVTETGVEWWGRGDNEAHHLADLFLPDAEPGGFALIVERAT
jgi:hypothetical protein